MERLKDAPIHYRLRDVHDVDGIIVRLEKYYPVKRTARGYWLVSNYAPNWLNFSDMRKRKHIRFVVDTSIKKYCYPTIEEAVNSFTRRKQVQQSTLSLQLEQVNCCMENIDKLSGVTVESFQQANKYSCDGILLGETPSHYRFDFD